MIKAILWDLDGVLIDSETVVYKRWAITYKELGFDLPESVFFKHIGRRPDIVFQSVNEELGIDIRLTYEQAYKIHKKRRGENPGVPLVEHIDEVLQGLSSKYQMAVVTSSGLGWLERMLMLIPYKKYFQVFVTGADIKNPKPHPEPYLKAIKKLQIKPEEAVVIEDSSAGITSGKLSGAVVIARKAKHNRYQDFSIADYVIEDMREIPKIIISLKTI